MAGDGGGEKKRWAAALCAGRLANDVLSFVVFTALDLLDVLLCFVYMLLDYAMESEWRPCYCSGAGGKDAIAGFGKIVVSEGGGGAPKVVSLCSSSKQLHLEDISDTLYSRPALLRDLLSRSTFPAAAAAATTKFTVNSTVIEMLQGRIGRRRASPGPRWSDCVCDGCAGWSRRSNASLFVKSQGPRSKGSGVTTEDVLFIHGFISSSAFWTETVFPNFTEAAMSRYRMIAVDLLGFGRSPKPGDSLYTVREHVEMIERSVLHPYGVKSFHIVAHSLGSILALALAVKHPNAVKSLTLLSPPYFPVPKGEQGTQFVLRRVAPRRVWPPMAFGASVLCWYEHISRTVSLLMCKNHRLWESLVRLVTLNRVRTFLMDGFFCHAHHGSWHTLHNIICGSAGKVEGYLDAVRDRLVCDVVVLHGSRDELLPVDCSLAVATRVPRARVKVVDGVDHITIVVGRQKAFAGELEQIWRDAGAGKRRCWDERF